MKYILLLTFLTFSFQNVFCQIDSTYVPFPTDSVAWNESGGYLLNDIPYQIESYSNFIYLIGDTIIDSFTYSKVYKGNEVFNTNELYMVGGLREEGKKIYFIDFLTLVPEEILYYDFSQSVGDTSFWDANSILESIDSFQLENANFRKKYTYSFGSITQTKLVEGIGNIERGYGGLLHPNDNFFFENINSINCMFTPNEIIYKAEWLDDDFDCHKLIPVSIKNIVSNNFKFYPNPFEKQLHFKEKLKRVDVLVYSMTGEIVFQKDNFSGNQIDLSFLKKGVYFLKVEQDYHKIVKF